MAKFLGRLVDFGIKKESTRGTAETSASFWLPKMSLSLDDKVDQVIDESSIGVIEDSNDAVLVKKYSEGEFEGKITDKALGLILLGTLGSVSTSGPTDSAYTHVFSVLQTAQHPALTLFIDDENQDYKHALGMITSLSLDISLQEFAKVKVGFRSKAGATTTNTPSYSAENSFLPQHGVFKLASTQSGLGAASAINIRSIKLDINKNVEDDDAIGSTAPVDILNKQFSIEGEVELVFNAETMKTEMLGDTVQAMRIDLIQTTLIGSTSVPRLTIDLHAVKFSEFVRNYSNGDIVTATAKFKAFYKLADSKMVTVTLINAQSSY